MILEALLPLNDENAGVSARSPGVLNRYARFLFFVLYHFILFFIIFLYQVIGLTVFLCIALSRTAFFANDSKVFIRSVLFIRELSPG